MFKSLGTDYRLAAWNMSFDLAFLKLFVIEIHLKIYWKKSIYRHIDVQTISFLAKELGYISGNLESLSDLVTYFGFSRPQLHSAKEDVEILYKTYKILINRFKERL
jgi:DNA polymerase III alpha subunit (gram-positive type)